VKVRVAGRDHELTVEAMQGRKITRIRIRTTEPQLADVGGHTGILTFDAIRDDLREFLGVALPPAG
jgi:hypothetical protein